MKYLLVAFLLCNSLAFGNTKPIDRVHNYAGNHKVTVRLSSGVYWVEMEDSDVFGVGYTLDEAANDFMRDADLEANKIGKPPLSQHEQRQHTGFICTLNNCI